MMRNSGRSPRNFGSMSIASWQHSQRQNSYDFNGSQQGIIAATNRADFFKRTTYQIDGGTGAQYNMSSMNIIPPAASKYRGKSGQFEGMSAAELNNLVGAAAGAAGASYAGIDRDRGELHQIERQYQAAIRQEKLQSIAERLNLTRNQARAKMIAGNLPSRMLKNFDSKKFELLGDSSFFYNEQTFKTLLERPPPEQKQVQQKQQTQEQEQESKTPEERKQNSNLQNGGDLVIGSAIASPAQATATGIAPIVVPPILGLQLTSIANYLRDKSPSPNKELLKQEHPSLIQEQSVKGNNGISGGASGISGAQRSSLAIPSSGVIQGLATGGGGGGISSLVNLKPKKLLTQRISQLGRSISTSTRQLGRRSEAFFKKLEEQLPVVSPSSRAKLLWDFLNVLVILISMFCIPVTAAFDFSYSRVLPEKLLWLIPNVLIVDVIINLDTGYFDKGQVIKDHRKIIQHYISRNMISDILSVVPFIFTLYGDAAFHSGESDTEEYYYNSWNAWDITKVLKILFFFKIGQISQILKKIEERFNVSYRVKNLIQLIKLLFTIILINHLFACLWVFIGKVEMDANFESNWMIGANVHKKDWVSQYLAAYYFTTVTMITVGYGDILPKNEFEMGLCVITMMLACGVFGYSLNEVGQIFSSFFRVDNEIKSKIITIQRFMSTKGINQKLQYQIREYLEYYWRESEEQDFVQEQNIINQLSESLRSKLLFEANKIALKDSHIFKHNFSKEVIEATVPLIKEIKFSPETFINVKQMEDDQAIYFIEKGSVEVILDAKNTRELTPLYSLGKGDSFGAYTFFTGLPRINDIRAKEFTTVLKIRRADFIQLIQKHPLDLETFCNIKDNVTFSSDFTKLGMRCYSCSSHKHAVNNCPYLHYVPNKPKIIKAHNNELSICSLEREPFKRREIMNSYNYKNFRSVFHDVIEAAIMFFEDNYTENNEESSEEYSEGYFGSEIDQDIDEDGEEDDERNEQEEDDKDDDENNSETNSDDSDDNNGPRAKTSLSVSTAKKKKIEKQISQSKTKMNSHQNTDVQEISAAAGMSGGKRNKGHMSGTETIEGGSERSQSKMNPSTPTGQTDHQEENFNRLLKQPGTPTSATKKLKEKQGSHNKISTSNSSAAAAAAKKKRKKSVSFTAAELKSPLSNGFGNLLSNSKSIPIIPMMQSKKSGASLSRRITDSMATSSTKKAMTASKIESLGLIHLSSNQLHFSEESISGGEPSETDHDKATIKSKKSLQGATKRIAYVQKFYEVCRQIKAKPAPVPTSNTSTLDDPPKLSHNIIRSNMMGPIVQKSTRLHRSQPAKSKTKIISSSSLEQTSYDTILKQLQALLQAQQQQQRRLIEMEDETMTVKEVEADVFLHFDRMKIFMKYCPRFNFPNIIQRANSMLEFAKKQDNFIRQKRANNLPQQYGAAIANMQLAAGPAGLLSSININSSIGNNSMILLKHKNSRLMKQESREGIEELSSSMNAAAIQAGAGMLTNPGGIAGETRKASKFMPSGQQQQSQNNNSIGRQMLLFETNNNTSSSSQYATGFSAVAAAAAATAYDSPDLTQTNIATTNFNQQTRGNYENISLFQQRDQGAKELMSMTLNGAINDTIVPATGRADQAGSSQFILMPNSPPSTNRDLLIMNDLKNEQEVEEQYPGQGIVAQLTGVGRQSAENLSEVYAKYVDPSQFSEYNAQLDEEFSGYVLPNYLNMRPSNLATRSAFDQQTDYH